jgi:DNA-directed RNA polymerase specialized sigma subunit
MSAKIYNSDDDFGIDKSPSMTKKQTPFPQTLDDWENILSDIDISLSEILLADPQHFTEASEQNNISQFWREMKTSSPFESSVVEALEILKPLEKKIIVKLFWEKKSLREVSSEIELSHTSISRHRDKAFEKLKKHFLNLPHTNSKIVTNIF